MATTNTSKNGNDGFWSRVKTGFTSGLETIGSDVLPVWAESRLKVRDSSPVDDPTYNASSPGAKTRLDRLRETLQGALPTVKTDVSLTPTTLALVAVVGIGAIWALTRR